MTKLTNNIMPQLPDDNILKEFILKKLQKYTAIPSLSGQESAFLSVLQQDFDEEFKGNWRKVHLDDKPHYYFRESPIGKQFGEKAPIRDHFLITHVDRVSSYKSLRTPFLTEISSDDTHLEGQLDNIIGIVVARVLVYIGLPVKILFTTKEELVQSTPQVLEVCKLSEKTPITVDIDVFDDLEQFQHGVVTLRKHDNAGNMLVPLVEELQKWAEHLAIPITQTDGYAIVETGFLSRATNDKYQGAHVGIPLINYHSDEEVTSWKVVYNTIKILHAFFTSNNSYK